MRSAVELAELWRSDKAVRKLEALMMSQTKKLMLIVSGTGEVIEPDDGIAAIGSGGNYALAARAPSARTPTTPPKKSRKNL